MLGGIQMTRDNILALILATLIVILIAFSLYFVADTQAKMFNDIDKICNNTNKTIIHDYGNIDCHRWNLRNYTMI